MIELTFFEASVWAAIIASLTSLVVVPLAIRYGTPDKKEK